MVPRFALLVQYFTDGVDTELICIPSTILFTDVQHRLFDVVYATYKEPGDVLARFDVRWCCLSADRVHSGAFPLRSIISADEVIRLTIPRLVTYSP